MNQWPNDSQPLRNGHAVSVHQSEPSMSFSQPPQTINPAQFAAQPYLNGAGAARTGSPAFHQSMNYQTNSVVPSKRSREDSMGTSPRPHHNLPPGSRSQTPAQPQFSGFNPQTNGATPFTSAPSQFQHLQTSNNATPSPTMQQMAFAPGGVPRVSTASPNNFSPVHSITGASPAPSDRGIRAGAPHDVSQGQNPNFMQSATPNPPFNQQFPQHSGGQVNMGPMGMGQQQMPQNSMNSAALYQQQLRQQMAAMSNAGANGMSNPAHGPMNMHGNAPNQGMMSHHQQQPIPQQQQQQQQPPPTQAPAPTHQSVQQQPPQQQQQAKPGAYNDPMGFFRELQRFMAAKQRPFEMKPQIAGRIVDLMKLYSLVAKAGGSARVTKLNQWPQVVQALGFGMGPNTPQIAAEVSQYWLGTVGAFEQMWLQKQRQNHEEAMRNRMQNQMSPTRDGPQNNVNHHQRAPSDIMNGKLPGTPQTNGVATSKDHMEPMPGHRQQSLSRQLDSGEVNGLQHDGRPQSGSKGTEAKIKTEPETELSMPIQTPIEDAFVPEVMQPSHYHGPINVEEMMYLGQQIIQEKPVVPSLRELGVVDIHAITMAIKSGMHAETRNALDTLVTISAEPSLQLSLEHCEDLMEALIDCAQVELDFLAENAAEVTDEIALTSYEEVVRACNLEAKTLQKVPPFGSVEYDLDRAADRLICITTLIRNFSFYEPNFATLGDNEVIQFITRVIQHIGTRDMPLRSWRNTLDFMKDVIVYLSNLSCSMHVPCRQDALCLLHFLLAFAPTPTPTSWGSDKVVFAAYQPQIHKYLPPAVDSLAKLLARDEPNRVYLKAIFAADSRASTPYELLTRAFGLVVAPIPQHSKHTAAQIEARKPFLLQGMLAAEILASLAPGAEKPLARSWLQSEDCFAGNMLRVASLVTTIAPPRPGRSGRNPQQPIDEDPLGHASLGGRVMAVLRILVNKARCTDSEGNALATRIPGDLGMKKDTMLQAMIQKDGDAGLLRTLLQYAVLEE